MIYVKKPNTKEKDFLDLLEKSKKSLLTRLNGKKNISPNDFERVIFERMRDTAKGTIFEGTVKQTDTSAFPDIIANKYFGVEVKMTTGDHWTSTGNSVLESSRIENVDRIYIMFGKFGGKFDIRYRLYQECLPEIAVTHLPRYRINMDLPRGKSIFDKMGVTYDALRKDSGLIKKIKDYYRAQLKEDEELWWIDQESDDKSVSPVIRPFRSLSKKEQENFVVEIMILFPEIFESGQTKFERAAAYLISEYNAVSANLRDKFTAGGKVRLSVNGKNVLLPRLAEKLHGRARAIVTRINEINAETLAYYWRTKKIEKDRIGQWKKFLNKKFADTRPSVTVTDVFESGLR